MYSLGLLILLYCITVYTRYIILSCTYNIFPSKYSMLLTVIIHKVGWALGAILYEINSLPWELIEPEGQPWGELFLAASIGILYHIHNTISAF